MKPYAKLLYYNQVNPDLIGGKFRGVTLKEPEDIIEYAGRWDYGEKNALKLGQKAKTRRTVNAKGHGLISVEEEVPIIQKYLDMGHESMIEMGDATFFIECSRVVSHEIVRHRIASYQQESQRFVKYDDESVADMFYVPEFGDEFDRMKMRSVFGYALESYKQLRKKGVAPQIARYVFPNATRTRLIMKANVREWRHICKLRLDKSAQPEMQEVMRQIYDQLVEVYPNAMHGVLEQGRGAR